jgi:metal-sulfur cluster biosynthetic enzyme
MTPIDASTPIPAQTQAQDQATPAPGPDHPAASALIPQLWEALRQVIDPEIGVNIVDLGLIYDITCHEGQVHVVMTVTTPGCPMEHSLVFGVETAVLATPGTFGVQVDVVHEPPWNPAMMTPEARAQAGFR